MAKVKVVTMFHESPGGFRLPGETLEVSADTARELAQRGLVKLVAEKASEEGDKPAAPADPRARETKPEKPAKRETK